MESSSVNGSDCIKCCSSNSSKEFMFDNYNHRLIVGSLVAFISFTGTCGSALVIIAVFLSRKLRTTTNVFVVNLSLSDLICCIVLSAMVYTTVYKGEDQPLPPWLCKSVAIALLQALGACIISLSLIAINRYVIITKPLATYQKVYRRRYIALMLAVSWIYPSILIGSSFVFSDSGQFGYSRKYRICFRNTNGENSSTINKLSDFFLVIPTFMVTLVAYALIYLHVRRHNKKRIETARMRFHPGSADGGGTTPAIHQGNSTSAAEANPSSPEKQWMPQDANEKNRDSPKTQMVSSKPHTRTSPVATKEIPPSTNTNRMPQDADSGRRDAPKTQVKSHSPHTRRSPEERIRKDQMDITKSLFIIVCVHIILMLPFAIVILIECSDVALPWIFVIFLATTAFNPLVYGWKHPHFRMVFKYMFTCRYRDIPEPSRLVRCVCFRGKYNV